MRETHHVAENRVDPVDVAVKSSDDKTSDSVISRLFSTKSKVHRCKAPNLTNRHRAPTASPIGQPDWGHCCQVLLIN
jgi:hypothetical protein